MCVCVGAAVSCSLSLVGADDDDSGCSNIMMLIHQVREPKNIKNNNRSEDKSNVYSIIVPESRFS